MSFSATSYRPYATSNWGGQATFRGSQGKPSQSIWGVGNVIYRSAGNGTNRALTGVTRNSSGVALGSCVVELFQTGGDIPTSRQTSDASGNFTFYNPGSGPFYLVAYKPGSPDLAGTTVNTLIAV